MKKIPQLKDRPGDVTITDMLFQFMNICIFIAFYILIHFVSGNINSYQKLNDKVPYATYLVNFVGTILCYSRHRSIFYFAIESIYKYRRLTFTD